jgi:hypothetical protein
MTAPGPPSGRPVLLAVVGALVMACTS